MLTKKIILAVALNLLFGGVGYFYIKATTRIPLAIFLTYATAYEFIRDLLVISNPATAHDSFAIHILPMLTLFGSIPGIITLVIMAIDIYYLVNRQNNKPHTNSQAAKAY